MNAVFPYNGGMANMDKNGLFNQQKVSASIDRMAGRPVRRSHSNKWVAGVCGGIGEYFNIDANLIRLIWVVVTLCSLGVGLVLYIVASLILPKKSDIYPGY